jgi:stress response protein YsnF
MSFGLPDWPGHTLNVNLTREQIENSPDVATDEPVSRQWETEYYGYYGWPYYWGGMGALGGMSGVGMGGWGSYWYPGELAAHPYGNAETPEQKFADQAREHADANLRSTKEVIGYGISATDGHIGHIEDFILDDGTWRIRYLAVDTRDWWPGKKVLLPPDWIGHVNWPVGNVTVNVTQDQVKNAPEWDSGEPINSAFEDQLYRYYSRQRPVDVDSPKHEDPAAPVPMF